MIKYKADRSWNPKITTIQADKETESSVWINGRMSRKMASCEAYFDTWDGAKAWLLEWAEDNAASARRNLESANAKLGNVKGIKQ